MEKITSNNKNKFSKLLRYIFLSFVIPLGLISMIATGGGGDGGSAGETTTSSNTDLSISNLVYDVGCGWTGIITFTGSVNFMDDDGNVSTLIIDIYRYNGNRVDQINEPIEGVSGQKSGTIPISVSIEDPLVAGYYYFELYVMDATDHESNVLTGTFDVTS